MVACVLCEALWRAGPPPLLIQAHTVQMALQVPRLRTKEVDEAVGLVKPRQLLDQPLAARQAARRLAVGSMHP